MISFWKITPALLLATACSTATSPTHAMADPPTPPNLADFKAVDSSSYEVPERWGPMAYFTTTTGIFCSIGNHMACTGPIHGVPNLTADCLSVAPPADQSDENAYVFTKKDGACSPKQEWKPLDAGTKISFGLYPSDEFTCGFGSDNVLSCIDKQHHGFVLQPTHSWTF